MKYELSTLGADGFERLIQSLLGGETFGDGPDGQREAVLHCERLEALPGLELRGYTVAQAKYKSPGGKEKDWPWLEARLNQELDQYARKKEKDPALVPETWLFFTNLILTPKEETGLKDKAMKHAKDRHPGLIPNIYILGADDLRVMLDRSPAVAASYSVFLTPSHLLNALRDQAEDAAQGPRRTMLEYARKCFREDHAVRLKQAGSSSEEKIDVRKVYTDLPIQRQNGKGEAVDFARWAVSLGEKHQGYRTRFGLSSELRPQGRKEYCYSAILGEAGQGKSTVCQLLCQLYRAVLLREEPDPPQGLESYFQPVEGSEPLPMPTKRRIPVLISLRLCAAWMRDREPGQGRLEFYLLDQIYSRTGDRLTGQELRRLLKEEAWVFCFDGLDEVPSSSNRSALVLEVRRFLHQEVMDRNCDALVFLTSRPQGYLSGEMEYLFRSYNLLPMEPERALRYCRRLIGYLEESPETQAEKLEIMAEALKDPMLSKLMTAPLYTSILLLLARRSGPLPNRRYRLFQKYCETIVDRELEKRLLPELEGDFGWVLQLHRELGLLLQRESDSRENAGAELPLPRLEGIIRAYLERREYEGDISEKTAALRDGMTLRLPFLARTVNSRGADCVLFPLRSIQEYYAAEGILALPDENLIAKTLDAISRSAYWRNVFLFAAGCYTADPEHYYNLNNQLYSICCGNNGDPAYREEGPLAEACARTHAGAWLALDLLCEGLFSRPGDRNRYCALLAPLLKEHGLGGTNDELQAFRRLSPELGARLTEKLLIPLLDQDRDGDSLALALLWDLAKRGIPAAAQALETRLPRLRVRRWESCKRLLSLGWEGLPDGALSWLYGRITGDFFPDFADDGGGVPYLRFLEACCRRFGWEALPLPPLRQACYFLCTYDQEIWMPGVQLSFQDPLLCAAWRAKLNRAMSSRLDSPHDLLWCRPLVRAWDGEEAEVRALGDQLTLRGLEELRTLLAFQRRPTAAGINAIASAWESLEPQAQEAYGYLLRCASWVLKELAEALEAGEGPEQLLPRGDASWGALLEEDRRLRDMVQREDVPAILARGSWDSRVGVYPYIYKANGEDLNLDELLRALEDRPLEENSLKLLAAVSAPSEALPSALRDFLLDRAGELVGLPSGNRLLLRLFAETGRKQLLTMDFPYPKTPWCISFGIGFPARLVKAALDKLSFLSRQAGDWAAWSLFPVALVSIRNDSILPAPVTGAELEEIRAAGNRAALFGGLLSRLTGPLEEGELEILAPELDPFLTGETVVYFHWVCDYFSPAGKRLLLRRSAALAPGAEPAEAADLADLTRECTVALLKDLQSDPATLPTPQKTP